MLKSLATWLVCALAVAMVTTGPASVTALPAHDEKDGGTSTDDARGEMDGGVSIDDTMAAQLTGLKEDDAVRDTTSYSMDDDYNSMATSSKEDAGDVTDGSKDDGSDVSTNEAITGRRDPNLNTVHVSSLEPHKLFQLVKISCSYHASRNWCRHHGMRLAVPRSPFENLLVRLTCTRHHVCRIGVNDLHHEGRYTDDDYRPLKFTNWYHGEPNNVHNEDCGEIHGWDGMWNDQRCHQNRFFICSRV